MGKLQSEALQQVLRNAGLNVSAKRFNFFRIFTSALLLFLGYGSAIVRGEDLAITPLAIVFLLWFSTSPNRFTLGGLIYSRLKKFQTIKRNGELMSFLKLYENNKRLNNLRFEHFLKRVAPHFTLIGKELIILSERVTDEGLEEGLKWFSAQYPNHPFVPNICTIILATEEREGEDVIQYLDQESHTIARISNDLYMSRWNTLSSLVTVLNSFPSFAMFFLIIILVVYYTVLVQSQIHF